MAQIIVQVLVPILLVLVAGVGATPPGIANNPSHATCKIKKYKHCYNLVHVCPKFCPDGCTVECASCKPICVGSSNPPSDSPTLSTPSTPKYPPPSSTPSPTTPSPSTPSPKPPSPSTPSPTIPSPSTPSTPSPTTPSPSTPSPTTPSPSTPSTPSPKPPSPSTPSPTTPSPSTPSTPSPTTPSPSTRPTIPSPSTPPTTPSPSTPSPTTPSPSTPSPTTPSPSTPSPTTPSPSTPSPTTPSPSTPSPTTPSPSTPSPTTPSPSKPKTARCWNKNYPKCYNMEHVCPNACPGGCEVDCNTCKPVCKCDRPGAICQDPRFIGGDGITFYFHGKKDNNFCLVSDPNLHINAHFIGRRNNNMKRDFTWVQSIAILFDNHQLFVGALKTATWQDYIDRLALTFDSQPITLDQSEGATWTSSAVPNVSIVRTTSTNSITLEVEGRLRVTAKVVPITEEDSRIHNYGITKDDCFAHLDLGFKFFNLSNEVSGVLGQTYKPNYMTSVNIGAKMPVMGGGKEFQTTNLFSPDCSVARFVGNNDEFMDKELSEGDSFVI